MPLRVWRTDEVTRLAPHPNDPALGARNTGTEFLTTFTVSVPVGTPGQAVDDIWAREARRAKELAGQGHLLRLWGLPGPSRVLGLWNAGSPAEMQAILKSLPMDVWMTVETTPLSRASERPGDDHPMTGNDRRVAIITGGSQGVGAGLVAGYRGRGWAVVASARTIKPSQDPDVLTVEGDIAKPATADRIIEGALGRFGRIDTLVNNAGVFVSKPFTDYTAEDYALVVGVNLTGFFWLTQRVIAEMAARYGGHVVNISATLAEVASSHAPSVLAALTKGGLAAATRSLAVEYASRGIRVNAVSPGIIQTPVHPPESYEGLGARLPPLGRVGQVSDIVDGILFLEVIALHHRRDPAHRRRPDRRPLTEHVASQQVCMPEVR